MTATDPVEDLVTEVRSALAAHADPTAAPAMQAYMKSAMPYRGVKVPVMRKLCKDVFARHRLTTAKEWESAVRGLWNAAGYREERYAAIELTEYRRYESFQTPDTVPVFEHMIVSGAWWDYVDPIASHRIGYLLRTYPKPIAARMRQWSKSPDMWKRRSSILCQLGSKGRTDVPQLFACIEPSLGSKEFFLQKAIGWALREHAKTDAAAVRRYVRDNRERLAPLSVREALRNL